MRIVLGLVIVLSGCIKTGEFKCATSADCDRNGAQGICEGVGYCSFADASCDSGRRFADLSGDVSNQCVGDQGAFSIGGTVSGLTGTGLVLQNNGGDDRSITMNGMFTFATGVADGAAYSVTVLAPPSGQNVSLTNSSGSVAGNSIGDVMVTCTPIGVGDLGILCGGAFCPTTTDECCHQQTGAGGSCISSGGACGEVRMPCSNSSHCGGLPNVCCARTDAGGELTGVECESSAVACVPQGNGTVALLCDPDAGPPCPNALTCVEDVAHGWFECR